MNKLTNRQKAFCEEYIRDWNAKRAAEAVGYSKKSAKAIGFENLTKPYIKEYIEQLKKDLEKVAGVSKLQNLIEIKKMAYGTKDDNLKIKALEVLNKMMGYDAPLKAEVQSFTLSDIMLKIENGDL